MPDIDNAAPKPEPKPTPAPKRLVALAYISRVNGEQIAHGAVFAPRDGADAADLIKQGVAREATARDLAIAGLA